MSVLLVLTHNISPSTLEKRYGLHQTIASIKANLATHFQTPTEAMTVALHTPEGAVVAGAMDDSRPLGFYGPEDGWILRVIHTDPATWVDYEDVSQVEKYVMPDEAYAQRTDSVRAFKARLRAAEEAAARERGEVVESAKKQERAVTGEEEASKIKVGDRCSCAPGDRIGTVRYVGKIASLQEGWWVGVEFDEPVGKSDGTVKGTRVFECRPCYAGFLRPSAVTIGDFPEETFD